MASVLVLGSAGYIGSRLVIELLRRGYDVVGIDNLYYNQGAAGINLIPYEISRSIGCGDYQFFKLDCNNTADILPFIKNADVIYPLHALVGQPLCDKHKKLTKKTNLESIKNIVDNLGYDQKVIFPNTNSGYGANPEICTEESSINCLSLYSKTKYEAEQYIINQHENSTVFRLATVFGMSWRPRLDLIVNNWIYRAYFDKEISIFNKDFRRNYVYIGDVVNAFIWAIDNGGKNEIYNLGNDGENKTKLELAKQICAAIPFKIEIGEGNDKDNRDYEVSSAKLKKAGFEAKIGIDRAITELKEYFSYLPAKKKLREKLLKYYRNY